MWPTRYFGRRLFAPRYFPRASGVAARGSYFAGRWFAKRYFAPRYFPGGKKPGPVRGGAVILPYSYRVTGTIPYSYRVAASLPYSFAQKAVLVWSDFMARNVDLDVYVGEHWTYTEVPDTVPAGGIAGWTIVFTVYDATETPVITKTVGAGITVLSANAGTFAVTLTAVDLDLTPTGTEVGYTYDLRRTDVGFEGVLQFGDFNVHASH